MTNYWEDQSDAADVTSERKRGFWREHAGATGVLMGRRARIVRHRADESRSPLRVFTVAALSCLAVAMVATSVSLRDTSAAARWMPDAPSGPIRDTQSADPPSVGGPATVDPPEDAQRRSQVGASTERATRERRPSAAPVTPSGSSSSSTPPSSAPPSVKQDPIEATPEPTPEPTPDPCDPKGEQTGEQPDPEQPEQPESEPTESDGSDGGEVPPVDPEPSPTDSETGS